MMTHDEMIAVIQAHKEGKVIEWKYKGNDEWKELSEVDDDVAFNFVLSDFRIKSEPHYRPFENAEEVMAIIKEHGGWVKSKYDDKYYWLTSIQKEGTDINGFYYRYDRAFRLLIFADGAPFGKLEE